MFNYRFMAVLKRELKQQIFSKRFIIGTLVFPLIMGMLIGVQAFVVSYDKAEFMRLQIINESESFQSLVQSQLIDSELNDNSLYELKYQVLNPAALDTYIEENRNKLLEGEITGVLYIPDSARDDKHISYYSSNPSNQALLSQFREHINKALIGEYFREINLDTEAITYARTNVVVDGNRVTEQGTSESNMVNFAFAAGFTFLLYMTLLIIGPSIMGTVNEEKNSKVVEVLFSAIKAEELLFGKILGTTTAGLIQMTIWMSPLIISSILSLPLIIAFDIQISGFSIVYFLINYLLGLLIYLSLFASIGAMFDSPQDSQSMMTPVMMLIIIPFLLAFSMVRNPANTLAEVASMMPFSSIMVMPARMTLINVPMWQLGVAVLVNIATIYFCLRFAAKIYRTTILLSGSKPSWKEVIRWIKT